MTSASQLAAVWMLRGTRTMIETIEKKEYQIGYWQFV
jgi:hypothetical protein